MAKNKYYVVWKGRIPGIYSTWAECKSQVDGFEKAHYKSFESLQEAEVAFKSEKRATSSKQIIYKQPKNGLDSKPTYESISVDAACSGNPGKMEYQGVFSISKEPIFLQKYELGTNNIGEFLAIVHALALVKKNGWKYHIFTDSMTALAWVRDKKCKTKLDLTNSPLKDIIARAENWLQNNELPTVIQKWNTAAWGEIPADFGRK